VEKELKDVLDSVRDAKNAIEKVEAQLLTMGGKEPKDIVATLPEHRQARVRVWKEIHEKGGFVTKEELHKIGQKYGFDPRGLGGFFVGDSSLVYLADGKVGLTSKAVRKMKEWDVIKE
jgi:hypothetical protein